MPRLTPRRAKTLCVRLMSALTAVCLAFNLVLPPAAAQAQSALNLPVPGTLVSTSPAFVPVLLKGLTLHPEDPLRLDFIVDSGHTRADADELQAETLRLVKYFLASMTIPQNDFWVNLSPVESDHIIPDELARTEMGRDMLAQDYLLKQLSASLLYPEGDLGEKFWEKIYTEAHVRFGVSEIPVNTFNKVWIVPEKAVVYEHGHTVYVVESRLKVMLDSDYAAWQENTDHSAFSPDQADGSGDSRDVETGRDLSLLSAQIVRDIIIPAIETEVNEGKNFAPLRQIYQSLILAKWYKETVKETLLAKVYVDQKKTGGIETDDTAFKDEIYHRYMEAYKQGVFNYIKEDYDRLSRQPIPRQYFSGGLTDDNIPIERARNPGPAAMGEGAGPTSLAELQFKPQGIEPSAASAVVLSSEDLRRLAKGLEILSDTDGGSFSIDNLLASINTLFEKYALESELSASPDDPYLKTIVEKIVKILQRPYENDDLDAEMTVEFEGVFRPRSGDSGETHPRSPEEIDKIFQRAVEEADMPTIEAQAVLFLAKFKGHYPVITDAMLGLLRHDGIEIRDIATRHMALFISAERKDPGLIVAVKKRFEDGRITDDDERKLLNGYLAALDGPQARAVMEEFGRGESPSRIIDRIRKDLTDLTNRQYSADAYLSRDAIGAELIERLNKLLDMNEHGDRFQGFSAILGNISDGPFQKAIGVLKRTSLSSATREGLDAQIVRLRAEIQRMMSSPASGAVTLSSEDLINFAKGLERLGILNGPDVNSFSVDNLVSSINTLFEKYPSVNALRTSPDDSFLKILVKEIVEILRHPPADETMRNMKMQATVFLSKSQGHYPVITEAMRELLGHQDAELRSQALMISREREDPGLIDTVENLLAKNAKDKMTEVERSTERKLAIDYLSVLDDPQAGAVLVEEQVAFLINSGEPYFSSLFSGFSLAQAAAIEGISGNKHRTDIAKQLRETARMNMPAITSLLVKLRQQPLVTAHPKQLDTAFTLFQGHINAAMAGNPDARKDIIRWYREANGFVQAGKTSDSRHKGLAVLMNRLREKKLTSFKDILGVNGVDDQYIVPFIRYLHNNADRLSREQRGLTKGDASGPAGTPEPSNGDNAEKQLLASLRDEPFFSSLFSGFKRHQASILEDIFLGGGEGLTSIRDVQKQLQKREKDRALSRSLLENLRTQPLVIVHPKQLETAFTIFQRHLAAAKLKNADARKQMAEWYRDANEFAPSDDPNAPYKRAISNMMKHLKDKELKSFKDILGIRNLNEDNIVRFIRYLYDNVNQLPQAPSVLPDERVAALTRVTLFDALFSGFQLHHARIIEENFFGRGEQEITSMSDVQEQLRADTRTPSLIATFLNELRKRPPVVVVVDQTQLETAFTIFRKHLAAAVDENADDASQAAAESKMIDWYRKANGLAPSGDRSDAPKKVIRKIMKRFSGEELEKLESFENILAIGGVNEGNIIGLIHYLYDNADRLPQAKSVLRAGGDSIRPVLLPGAYLDLLAGALAELTGDLKSSSSIKKSVALVNTLFEQYALESELTVSPDDDPFLKTIVEESVTIFKSFGLDTVKDQAVTFLKKFKGPYPVITEAMRELLRHEGSKDRDIDIRVTALRISEARKDKDPGLIEAVKNLLVENAERTVVTNGQLNERLWSNVYLSVVDSPQARAVLEQFGTGKYPSHTMKALMTVAEDGFDEDFDQFSRHKMGGALIQWLNELLEVQEYDDLYGGFMALIDDMNNGPFKEAVKVLDNSSISSSTKQGLDAQIVRVRDGIVRMMSSPAFSPEDPSRPLSGEKTGMDKNQDVGGIDFNDVPVERQGDGTPMPFDPTAAGELLNRPITGFEPVILNIQPLPSLRPLLGLDEPAEHPEAVPPLQQARLQGRLATCPCISQRAQKITKEQEFAFFT